MQTPYRTSPRSTMTGAPGGPPGPPPMTVFASAADQMPYPGRGYPEPAAPRLFDPRADYAPQAYSRDRYDAQPYPPPSQYAVYDGGGGAGKRGREFGVSVNGNGYPPQNYVAETGYGGEGMGDGKSGGGGRKRRGNLPKETTDKLRAWFVGHLHHPYPTEDEKQDLMVRTGLQMSESFFSSPLTCCWLGVFGNYYHYAALMRTKLTSTAFFRPNIKLVHQRPPPPATKHDQQRPRRNSSHRQRLRRRYLQRRWREQRC